MLKLSKRQDEVVSVSDDQSIHWRRYNNRVKQTETLSKADWIRLWNTERHVNVCNEHLQPVFDAACQNDVRKITKRTGEEFVKEWAAKDFLIGSKRKRGLNEECCHEDTGCVWEEVAEYCKKHGREKHKPGSTVAQGKQGR
ncbi:insulin-like peptide 7 isoform X2 [Asterias amurensis]|uniref:insulin-like peptide 7 isoform X2 n=1 Tax=Asterias amurensis TaxID=7602 RepID=UPI003AB5E83E